MPSEPVGQEAFAVIREAMRGKGMVWPGTRCRAVLSDILLVAQDLKMAQGVDVQIGRDRYDRYDRDRRRDDATVGIGPGGVTIGPRQRCRIMTTTIERGDRTITRRERRCD
jgi:hypothetical protein